MRHALAVAVLSAALPAAALDLTLPHSGYVLDANDLPPTITGQFRFRLFSDATDGTAVWESGATPCALAVNRGYYATVLGEGCGPAISDALFLADPSLHLEVELGGITLVPRHAVTAPAGGVARALPIVSSRPAAPVAGQTHYNAATTTLELFDGTQWVQFASRKAASCLALWNQGVRTDGPYTITVNGVDHTLWCDMNTDGGGWTLVHKSLTTTTAERTDAGYNLAGLANTTLDAPAVLPRTTINLIGNEYRWVNPSNGQRFFWRNGPYYVVEPHSTAPSGVQYKLDWTAAWATAFFSQSASHAICYSTTSGFSAEHVCLQRYCCGTPNGGGWWNGGSYGSGSYRNTTGWVR